MTESQQDAYDRGSAAGGLAERLAGYDRHFERINGSIEKGATAQVDLAKQVQRLADQADAREKAAKISQRAGVSRLVVAVAWLASIALTVAVVLIVTQ
jgi:hypothetical protein